MCVFCVFNKSVCSFCGILFFVMYMCVFVVSVVCLCVCV